MSSATDGELDDANTIVQRMAILRSIGKGDVRQLQQHIERASDWREHVRARPLVATFAAGVVGFVVVRTVFARVPATTVGAAKRASVSAVSSTLAFVGGTASSMIRQWLTDYVKNEFKIGHHGKATESNAIDRPADIK